MTFEDEDVDRLLRELPAPGVPAEARERHLAALREATASESTPAQPVGRILRRGHGPYRRRARRRRVLVTVVAAAVVVVLGTAAARIALERATERSETHCYPIWTTDFDNPALGGDAMEIGQDSASAALDVCRSLWAGGSITTTPPYTEPKGQSPVPATPPPLIACVLPKGSVGVFPAYNHETCAQLGLPTSEG